ncbi:MAG: M14 family zinc carboxypeptidase [Candidatus Cloacimonadaceae bacterium]|nr:M14 family zinc carboxypeptidase [Candidatus Cloacimonadaceae bacterium]MDP3113650.1 M14 family zinc carboxypeptidase [Candidatus Cloacimonadaceae bacterium]
MKRFFLSALLALSLALLAAFPVKIDSWNLDDDLKTLNLMSVSIDHVNRSTGSIIVYLRDDIEFNRLLSSGLDAVKLPDPAKENARLMRASLPVYPPPQNQYYTIDQYHQFMIQTAAQYPQICQLVQAGSSVQNRPLYFLKISDNVAINEAEPEVRYISSMHGNEVLGFDLLIRLIQLITSGYATNNRIANLVNNTEIWICPMMNPDGYVAGQRYNAAGIDLNRNFPMPTGVQNPDGNAWAPENTAIMGFFADRNIVLSANFHGGALVMNYPWDYTYTLATDDALLIQASLVYSQHNLPMYNNPEFPQGITNGAAWYVITGSMQDWFYYYTNAIDITAEVSNEYWPVPSTLPTFWAQNQESMLSYLEFASRGVRGLVTNSGGAPLAANISVSGNAKRINTDPALGDYHRLLLPGTYTVTAAATGYLPQSVGVTVSAFNAIVQNFVLEPAQITSLQGIIRNQTGNGIGALNVRLNTIPPISVTTAANGTFTIPGIYEGDYQVSVSDANWTYFQKTVSVRGDTGPCVMVLPSPQFVDDFENGIANWTATSPWGIVLQNGNNVLTDSPAGNYANNINRAVRLTNPINLQSVQNTILSFKTKYFLETGYDNVFVEASANNNTWTELTSFTGTQNDWIDVSVSLAAFSGGNCYVRFRLQTDNSVIADGIYIDNVRILGFNNAQTVFGDIDANWVINRADAQAVLEYATLLDPIPAIDALPWEAHRYDAADVDNDGLITAMDAFLILNYLVDPSYRFAAQGAAAFQPGACDPVIASNGGISMSFNPAANLKGFSLQILPTENVDIGVIDWQNADQNGITAINPAANFIAWARKGSAIGTVDLDLLTQLTEVTCAYNINGNPGSAVVSVTSSNEDPATIPAAFQLLQNHPNPFNPSTTIRFSVGGNNQAVKLLIYNTRGQIVRNLMDEQLPAGHHQRVWDGRDNAMREVGSGVYLYVLQSGSAHQVRKMILLK